MDTALHRHDISDRAWEIIAPHVPGKPGDWGGIAQDNRKFINAVVWILRTGSSLARSSAGTRRLEKHSPPLLPLARQRRMVALT